MQTAGIATGGMSVRLSVCLSVRLSVRHTPVLYQNEESHDFFTIRELEHSTY